MIFFINAFVFSVLVVSCAIAPSTSRSRHKGHVSSSLMMCYENATLFYETSTRVQPSIAGLIALISKVERSGGGNNMNMRTLSATILHRFRLDGLERDPTVPNDVPGIVPFMTTGRQYPKYQIVMDQLIPSGTKFPEESLEDFEKCALHFMISATVQPWTRGDEHEVCPLTLGGRSRSPMQPQPRSWSEWPTPPHEGETSVQRSSQVSRCPIEEGVLWTPWGAVAGSSLLGGIAAGLQFQSVEVEQLKRHRSRGNTDTTNVDNVWGSTLSGDLAEVALYQGPRAYDSTYLRMGPGGSWNDTALPRMLYFDPWTETPGDWEQESWDITEAEMRGGIDGLVLGTLLPEWVASLSSLRLSQLLDMYYSERGVAMDVAVRACRRSDLSAQTVLEPTLRQQTDSFSRVLYDHESTMPITPETLSGFSNSAVDAYLRFSEAVLLKDSEMAPCSENKITKARIEMLTVLDGSWTLWEGQRVISVLEQYTDISTFGSAISIMDGWKGTSITNFTRMSTYTIRALEDPISWPIGLDLELTVRGARHLLMRRRSLETRRGEDTSVNSRGTVVVVLAMTATNNQETLNRAQEEMRMLKEMMPDVTWLFVTAGRSEDYIPFVENPERDIIKAKQDEFESYMPALIRRLREVPGRILPEMCPSVVQDTLKGYNIIEWEPVETNGTFNEDYVTPSERRLYRVTTASLHGVSQVKFTLKSSNYGDLLVCISRVQPGVEQPPPQFPNMPLDDEEQCDSLKANSEVKFTVDRPCSNMADQSCRPIFLWLEVETTQFKCTENNCRYPDQVRYTLWHEGLNPLPGCTGSLASSVKISSSLLLLMVTLVPWRWH